MIFGNDGRSLEAEIIQAYPNGKILLISHGGFIVQVLRVLRMDSEDFLQNTSLTILLRQEKRLGASII